MTCAQRYDGVLSYDHPALYDFDALYAGEILYDAAIRYDGTCSEVIQPSVVIPDRYPGGVPSTKFIQDTKWRNGWILHGGAHQTQDRPVIRGHGSIQVARRVGSGTIWQAPSEVSGIGRVKRAVLIATGGEIESGGGYCGESDAEFIDTALEAFAIAAAIGVTEWQRAA